MTKRNGRWAITERWAVREWLRSDAGRYRDRGNGTPAGRGDDDQLWKLQRKLGIGQGGRLKA
jgi:hypothetical protein